MPEEMESPMERAMDDIHEAALDARQHWIKWSALISALFAVLAAIGGLQSAHYANDAMIEQIEASDQWGYYQAKGIKALVKDSERNILAQMGKTTAPESAQQLEKYKQDQEKSKEEATRKLEASKQHLERHEMLSRAVTVFQIAIALTAIAVLSRRRAFLLFSCALGVVGACFLIYGQIMPG